MPERRRCLRDSPLPPKRREPRVVHVPHDDYALRVAGAIRDHAAHADKPADDAYADDTVRRHGR